MTSEDIKRYRRKPRHARNKDGSLDFRDRLQIVPEKRTPTSSVCSIGKSMKDGKWYGWSHRAYGGFKTRAEAIRFAESVR